MQLALVIVAVLLSGAYLARGVWRTWASTGCGSGCGGGCGPKPAAPSPPLIAVDDLTARLRARN